MKSSVIIFLLVLHCALLLAAKDKQHAKGATIEDITDLKDLRKLLRTKNNVMVLFVSSAKDKEAQSNIKIFRDAANLIRGVGTMVLIDCMNGESKKMCKKMKIKPEPVLWKHYKDGEFNQDYSRQVVPNSIFNFMRDPTGDLPWDEDPIGADVVHVDVNTLERMIKRESKPIMIMFYAPWCTYCKTLKPEYSSAATELKNKCVLAAIDVHRPENTYVRNDYNITGFPTLLYYESGKMKQAYEGDNDKKSIVAFMLDPSAPPPIKPKEAEWATEANSEIVHLTSENFAPALQDEKSALVMFHAPWCGHCKTMKPEYEKAAVLMKEQNIPGVLAALDGTKDTQFAMKHGVQGYPSVKYFVNGEFKFDVKVRVADKIVSFMKDPSEPPPPPPPEVHWSDEANDVQFLDSDTFKPFLKKKKHVLVMFYAPWCGHCKKAKPEFDTAAAHFKDNPRVELAAIDCTKLAQLCSEYSVKGYPTIKYFSYLKTEREYTGGRLAPDFIRFLTDPDAPEPVPVAQPFGTYPGSDFVTILSDSDFDEKIMLAKRALVMFYAPWCGHCTQMKAAYSLAAERLSNSKTGVLAAVDATVSKVLAKRFGVSGFPTLKYFEDGEFQEDYQGKRTADDLYKYVSLGGSKKTEL